MTEPTLTLMSVRGLGSPYGGPFDLELAPGECIAVLGASGSGKSVLLRLIADMDPGRGAVALGGIPREHFTGPCWRQAVVYQAAEPAWWEPTAAAHFRAGDTAWVAALLAELRLDAQLLHTDIARLSTGERQRLALVRSLACRPRVLLLDEPSAALDAASIAAMEAVLRAQLAAGLGIVLVTHSPDQAKRLGHRRFELREHTLHGL
jgi:ABC-type iron transport system FetAB ATPase subunit